MKKYHIQTLSLILLALIDTACGRITKKSDIPGAADRIYTVSTAFVVSRDIPDAMEMKGFFTAIQRVDIKSEFTGKVQALSVTEGQVVATGDALLKIEDDKISYVLDRQRAELKEAEAQLELDSRVPSGQVAEEALGEVPEAPEENENNVQPYIPPNIPNPTEAEAPTTEGTEATAAPTQPNQPIQPFQPVIPPITGQEDQVNEVGNSPFRRALQARNRFVRRAPNIAVPPPPPRNVQPPELVEGRQTLNQAKIDRLKAEVALSEKQLAGSAILSPIDGFVSKISVAEGSLVQINDLLMTIIDLNPIELTIQIPKEQIDKINKSMEFKVVISDVPSENFTGEISYIGAEVDPAKKTVEVRIRIANPGFRIKVGMDGQAQLAVANHFHPAILVPPAAIITQNNKKYVYVVRGQRADRIEVETGGAFEGMVEVTNGLRRSERVVTTGVSEMKEEEEYIKIQP